MLDVPSLVIPTASKAKIHNRLFYPIGAEVISMVHPTLDDYRRDRDGVLEFASRRLHERGKPY